jgi:hypothetical protein
MQKLMVTVLWAALTASAGASAQCFELWGPSNAQLDSICFSAGGGVQLLNDGIVKFETQASAQFIGAHTIERPGLSEGHIYNIPDSISYSARDIELDATVPLQPPQGIHTRYGDLVFQGQQYIVGQ